MNSYVILIIYAVGALATHFLVYDNDDKGDVEEETANIVCVFWPLAFVIGIIMEIIRWWKKNIQEFDDWMY